MRLDFRRCRLVTPLLGLALVLTACAGGSTAAGGTTMEQALGYTPERWRALVEQRDAAVEACMRDAGLRFRVSTDWTFLSASPRGPFDLSSPAAVVDFQRRHGYGLVERVDGLRKAERDFAAEGNEEYYSALAPAEQRRFRTALYGEDGEGGCAARGLEVSGGIPLPEGGELGEDYGSALGQLYESSAYESWEGDVVDCLTEAGVPVVDGELATAARPHLIALLELTGSTYGTDDDGRIKYTMSVDDLGPEDAAALARLAVEERRTAEIEADCREQNAAELERLLADVSRGVLEEHGEDISALREALLATGRHSGPPVRDEKR